MRNGLYGFGLLAAVLVGFNLWDTPPKSPPGHHTRSDAAPSPIEPAAAPMPAVERYTSGVLVETIDLSRTFEPTGDELALRILLDAAKPEELPLPRSMRPELAPLPRLTKRSFSDAAEETSSPRDRIEQLHDCVKFYVAEKWMELLLAAQPLKGTD